MPTVRVHHADGLWLADLARLAASARNAGYSPVVKGGAPANFKRKTRKLDSPTATTPLLRVSAVSALQVHVTSAVCVPDVLHHAAALHCSSRK